jgi:hypothetical protein
MRSRKAFYATLWAFILWGSVMADWSLKDMGQAYIDENVAEEIVQLDSSNYVPVKYNALCEENAENLKACQPGARKLKILLIDQLPVMATQLGCGKRIFHMLESLVGLGHEVTMAYLRPDSHETEHDQNLIRRLNVPIKYSPLLLGDIKEDYKKLLEETQPDVLLMTLWYWQTDKPWFNAPGLFAVYTRKMLPATRQIIITDDVHWLRLERLADSRKASGLRSRDSSAMSPEAQV